MLWALTVLLLGLWLLGYISQVGGGFIHLLLFVAVIRHDLPPGYSAASGLRRSLQLILKSRCPVNPGQMRLTELLKECRSQWRCSHKPLLMLYRTLPLIQLQI